MLTILGMIGLVALGILIGRYPDFLWRHSRFLLSGPRLLWFWLLKRVRQNPAVFGAFVSGFFAGLLVSGRLNELLWYILLTGLLVLCLGIVFPAAGGRVVRAMFNFSRLCVVRIKKFFA